MKTSNKILLALIVIVFTVPLLLANVLKNKMKRGEFTIVKYEPNNPTDAKTHSGSFDAFKVIKVVAPNADFFTCHMRFANEHNYKYYLSNAADDITIFTNSDTLYINYKPGADKTQNNKTADRYAYVDVGLPFINAIVVDGALVVLDLAPASFNNFSVTLKNRGKIVDGAQNFKNENSGGPASSALKKFP